jgi:hypothetical protein
MKMNDFVAMTHRNAKGTLTTEDMRLIEANEARLQVDNNPNRKDFFVIDDRHPNNWLIQRGNSPAYELRGPVRKNMSPRQIANRLGDELRQVQRETGAQFAARSKPAPFATELYRDLEDSPQVKTITVNGITRPLNGGNPNSHLLY